jgi:hypothetical protein
MDRLGAKSLFLGSSLVLNRHAPDVCQNPLWDRKSEFPLAAGARLCAVSSGEMHM